MNIKKLIVGLFLLLTFPLSAKITSEQLRERMIIDLDHIKHVLDLKYAPACWKNEVMGCNLEGEYSKAKEAILEMQEPSIKEFQMVLKRFFNAAKDYHVGISFYSTEKATLPFTIKEAEGHYFVVHLAKGSPRNLRLGDEVIAIDGTAIQRVMEKITFEEVGNNKEETDHALAEILLTNRSGAVGHFVPKGEVMLTVKHKSNNKQENVSLEWKYEKEEVSEVMKKESSSFNAAFFRESERACLKKQGEGVEIRNGLFNKMMMLASYANFQAKEDPYIIGSRKGFLPPLGKKVWESANSDSFYAYITELREDSYRSKKVGYIRIPSYIGGKEGCEDFRALIARFEEETDALVIDQTHNPGGSVLYLYGLLSVLTDKPLIVPKHRMILTQEEVYTAANLLSTVEDIQKEEEVEEIMGKEIGGYPITFDLVQKMKSYCNFIISQWEEGNQYIEATPLLGIDQIEPSTESNYTKPIMVLVDELDFSAADFFPAILQDNKRALIFGKETAGAGGYLITTEFPNQTGIHYFSFTGSFAERMQKVPIENLGVTPDIHYDISARDIREGYEDYLENLKIALHELLMPKKNKS